MVRQTSPQGADPFSTRYSFMFPDFEPNVRVKVIAGIHKGQQGTVVKVSDRRRGLVPVYLPEFAATVNWWFAPWQLEVVKED